MPQVQARIHLARRLRARPEPARQDEGRGVRRASRRSSELPLWGFDGSSTRQAEGSNSDCMLKPVAVFPDPARDERRARHVRGAPARTGRRTRATAARRSRTTRTRGSASSRSTSSTGTALRSASRPAAGFPPPQGEYYTGVGYKNVGEHRARDRRRAPRPLPRRPASTTRASTPRSRRASGSSRSSARARSRPPTRCGSPATSCCGSASATASTSTSTASRSAWTSTGTARACTRTSRPKYMREVGGEEYFEALMAAFDDRARTSTSPSTAPTTTCGSPGSTRRSRSTRSTTASPTAAPRSASRTASWTSGYRGYLEDRRPNSLGDPYRIAGRILETIRTVPVPGHNGAAPVGAIEAIAAAAA